MDFSRQIHRRLHIILRSSSSWLFSTLARWSTHMRHRIRGRKRLGMAAVAAAVALGGALGRKGVAASSSPIGRGSDSVASLFPIGHRSSSAAPVFPIGSGSNMASASAASGAAESSTIYSRGGGDYTSHGGGGFTGTSSPTSGFPFLSSPSPALWDSAGASLMSPSFGPPASLDLT